MTALDIYEQTRAITDPESRRRHLDEACRGDANLRCRVEAMLLISAVPESFLGAMPMDRLQGTPATDTAIPADGRSDTLAADPFLGTVIGDVALERLVGQGGMGRVYAGTQASTGGDVAVKLLMPHVVSAGMLKRFEQEVRLLARLRHPGIAQVHSAGTATCLGVSLPYFVMEFIADARPITAYADEHGLNTRQRLELFRKVCDAVAHGHAQRVIHRDLKPANILVDRFGQPKVIDFGVAKCTDADLTTTTLTTEGGIVGTLRYMSPEQAAGDADAIDARADVHALGVILYELLASRMPFDFDRTSPIETVQILRTKPPRPLSSVSRAFRGDLEAITAKCLEKNRLRRYATAGELDAEIGRYLAGQRVLARQAGPLQTALKNVANRTAAAAAVFAAVAGLATIIGIRAGDGPRPSPTIPRADRPSAALPRSAAADVVPAGIPPPPAAPFNAAEARGHQEAWAAHLGIGVETTNSLGQTLVVIPPGHFTRGVMDLAIAGPLLLGRTEVTQGQWRALMGTQPWKGRPHAIEGSDVAATFVSWDDAVAFCGQLTARERRDGRIGPEQEYRLPTQAEWEFACRAGTDTSFGFGNARSLMGSHAWYGSGRGAGSAPIPGGNTATEPYAHAVACKQPNAWGLYDVHGNVMEWCADLYSPDEPNRNVRGGGWLDDAWASGARHGHAPYYLDSSTGFRVALDPPAPMPSASNAVP